MLPSLCKKNSWHPQAHSNTHCGPFFRMESSLIILSSLTAYARGRCGPAASCARLPLYQRGGGAPCFACRQPFIGPGFSPVRVSGAYDQLPRLTLPLLVGVNQSEKVAAVN